MIDLAQFNRLGDAEAVIRRCPKALVLDHHLEDNPSGDLHFIDTSYAAASEIVFDLFLEGGIPISRAAAECLYVGLATDTGGFRFGNTNAGAHRRAAKLVETGIDVARISGLVFDAITPAKAALLQRVLERLETAENARVAYSYITARDMEETRANGEDVEGLVNYARNLEGVDAGLLFREVDNGAKVKVSMRSTNRVNSAAVLKRFGGGGHAGAAGATLEMPQAKAMKDVLDAVRAAVREGAA
jgi:phosphoesterase RecJ-like protein